MDDVTREATADLVVVLADCKRLLGTRYADWILGAPELEAGIACAAMAQDEWGHARLLYAILKDFGRDIDHLEHGREPEEYCSLEALDSPARTWPDFVVLNTLVDAALTIQFEALGSSSFAPLRQRVHKMLEEERFHAAHGEAWFRRLTTAAAPRRALRDAASDVLPCLVRWFGPDSERADRLHSAGVVDAAGDVLRERYVDRVAWILDALSLEAPPAGGLGFDGFDEGCRRSGRGGPDAATVARVRGDRNRVFLMD